MGDCVVFGSRRYEVVVWGGSFGTVYRITKYTEHWCCLGFGAGVAWAVVPFSRGLLERFGIRSIFRMINNFEGK